MGRGNSQCSKCSKRCEERPDGLCSKCRSRKKAAHDKEAYYHLQVEKCCAPTPDIEERLALAAEKAEQGATVALYRDTMPEMTPEQERAYRAANCGSLGFNVSDDRYERPRGKNHRHTMR